ncbi:hypothetical protein SCHPADRAFT_560505 [Schizopora paradoxa]|uniref:Uncharacterized protein n=1 Tax=Schizopora paradoxa TaxID=27342 RepID=A0A0H2RDF9_9AGAM|nr:hypothetical protein SCHPADRAFT_560505 [Schizopora paradoxa]
MRNMGERILRVGNKLHRVKVAMAEDRALFIEHNGEMLRPWRWFLQMAGKYRMTELEKRDTLRHDGDASQLLRNEVRCRACNSYLKVVASHDRGHTTYHNLVGWLTHKLSCGALQMMLEKKLASHSSQPKGAPKTQNPTNTTKVSPSLSPTKAVKIEQDDSGCDEGIRDKILCRTAHGIQEVVRQKQANGRKSGVIHILADGKSITPVKYLFLGKRTKHSGSEAIDFLEQDIDGEFMGTFVRCKGCTTDLNIQRSDTRGVTVGSWLNHKFICRELQ